MTDLNEINFEFFKPYLTVLNYFRITGIDIFDEKNTLLFKFKYSHFAMLFLYIISSICHWLFIVIELKKGTNLLELAVDLSFAYCIIQGICLQLYIGIHKRRIRDYLMLMERQWHGDEGLSSKVVLFKNNQVNAINTYIYALALAYVINGSLLFLAITINQLKVLFVQLQEEFKDIIQKRDANIDIVMKKAVQKHLMLSNLMGGVSSAYGAIFAIHLVFFSTTICFYGISATINGTLEDYKNLMVSGILIINIYNCCKQGHLLNESAKDIGTAVYESPWEDLDVKNKKSIILIILRAQRATFVQSTYFTVISLNTFINIMKTSWSFLSLITTIYKDK